MEALAGGPSPCELSKIMNIMLDASHEYVSVAFQAVGRVIVNVWENHVMSRAGPANVTLGAVGAASKQTFPGLLLSPLHVKLTVSARTHGVTMAAAIKNAGITNQDFRIFPLTTLRQTAALN
jgi:hypothetical protein